MRRFADGIYAVPTILLLIILCLAPTSTQAQTVPQHMAGYVPDDVDFFAVMRSDEDFITRLDRLFMTVSANLPSSLTESLSINDLVNQLVAQSITLPIPLDFISVAQQALGDWVGVGVSGIRQLVTDPTAPISLYLTFEIGDFGVAQMLMGLLAGVLKLETQEPIGDFAIYGLDDLHVALSETVLHITYRAELPLSLTAPLSNAPLFMDGLRQLPESDYDLWAYVNTPALSMPFIQDAIVIRVLGAFGVTDTTTGAGMLGVRLGDTDLTLDVVQNRDVPQARTNTPIDPSFWEFIPPQAKFFLHTTDLTNLVESASAILASISASDTPDLIMRDFVQFTRVLLQADLQADILSWTTGDYALWGDFDPYSLTAPSGNSPLYFGVVLKTTSPENSAKLVTLLASAAQTYFDTDPNFSLHETRMNDTDVVFISLPTSTSEFLPSEIAIGANDDIFFIATPSAAQDLLTRHDGYVWAIPVLTPTFLESPKVALYLDGDAVGEVGVIFAMLIQPVQQFFFGQSLTQEGLNAYKAAFAQLFPAMSLSAKAGEGGDVVIRYVAQINAVLEGNIPSE
ncbi:MAG: DUF3352 domain-containing protein [bacterium]|nr:DUF3352 domain-containing protein [bacterium]